ncbi:MAG: hypothetical protein CSA66_07410 [Proteobacteria bacterium]|nr:MAG: hypothetical protein CSA66_07410 [Pseudomonadota bacterium]
MAYKIPKLKPITVKTMTLKRSVGIAAAAGVIGLFAKLVIKQMTLTRSNPLTNPTPGIAKNRPSSGRRPADPFTDHDFHIVIDGVEAGAFAKFDGLSWDCDVIEYKDSLDPHPRKRPGIHRFGNIKLTKGVITNSTLWDWCQAVADGKPDRRNGAIMVLDRTSDTTKPALVYEFYQAWPVKWGSFRVDGKGGATMVEELELAVDSFAMKK